MNLSGAMRTRKNPSPEVAPIQHDDNGHPQILTHAYQVMAESERRLRTTFDILRVGINHVSPDGRILLANPRMAEILGYAQDELIGMKIRDLVLPEDRESKQVGLNELRQRLHAGEIPNFTTDLRYLRKDGSVVWVALTLSVLRDTAGAPLYDISVFEDISERKRAEETMRNQALRQRVIAEFGQQALANIELGEMLNQAVELVRTTLKVDYSDVMELLPDGRQLIHQAVAGWPAEWAGQQRRPFDPQSHFAQVLSRSEPVVIGDYGADERLSQADLIFSFGVRSSVWVPILGTASPYGMLRVHTLQPRRFSTDEVSFLRSMANILAVAIERKNAEQRLAHLAQFDSLTGLPNRYLFRDRLAQALAQAKRNGQTMAMLFIDLDRFKQINDSLGHGVGDLLLKQVSARLSTCVRDSDSVGRFGGDEFGAILANLAKSEDAGLVAQKIIDAMAQPFDLDGTLARIGASIGVSVFPADGETVDTLINSADIAMYQAKQRGRGNYQNYRQDMARNKRPDSAKY